MVTKKIFNYSKYTADLEKTELSDPNILLRKIKLLEREAEKLSTNKNNLSLTKLFAFISHVYFILMHSSEIYNIKYYLIQQIYKLLAALLNDEYDKLNRVNNKYKYVPKEWLTLSAIEIIRIINKSGQIECDDGRIYQHFYVDYEYNKACNSYTIIDVPDNKKYNAYYYHGGMGVSLQETLLNYWEYKCSLNAE